MINNKGIRLFRRLDHEILEHKLNGERTKVRRGLVVKRYKHVKIVMRVVEQTRANKLEDEWMGRQWSVSEFSE